jgi:glycosyltransferase involved in cell wall biosynthesis
MLRAAEHLGVPAWSLDISPPVRERGPGVPHARSDPPPEGAPLVLHINAPLLPLAMLRLGRAALRRRRIVGYWAWELPTVSPDWYAGAKFVHEVWVPSRFTADALTRLLPGRVRVVPPAVAVAPSIAEPDRQGFGLPRDTVTVLVSFNLASSFERKNPLAAIAAFHAAFGDRNDRLLVIKVGYPDHFPADLARLRDAIGGMRNIRLDSGTLSPHRSRVLIASADIVLSMHRSEGFGLVPAEAMLLGKPVIATGWSGNMDFMDADCAVPIGYRLVPVTDPRGVYDIPDAVWAEADLDEAVEQLRRLADDPILRAALGARARAAVMARLTTAPRADALRGLGLDLPCSAARVPA